MSNAPSVNLSWPQPTDWERVRTRIADRAAVECIELNGTEDRSRGEGRWFDIRPMLDEREHSPPFIDWAREEIDWALFRGYAQRHPHHPHLLRILRDPPL